MQREVILVRRALQRHVVWVSFVDLRHVMLTMAIVTPRHVIRTSLLRLAGFFSLFFLEFGIVLGETSVDFDWFMVNNVTEMNA